VVHGKTVSPYSSVVRIAYDSLVAFAMPILKNIQSNWQRLWRFVGKPLDLHDFVTVNWDAVVD
jgi:hypothetical protein